MAADRWGSLLLWGSLPEAKARARALLLSCLTPQQQVTLHAMGFFDMTVAARHWWHRRRTYRIYEHSAYVVHRIGDTRHHRWCAIPIGPRDLPAEDLMLTAKLWLETDPQHFFKVANSVGRSSYPCSCPHKAPEQ